MINDFIFFSIAGLINVIFLMVIYFSKKGIDTQEKRIYQLLMFLSILGIVNEILMVFSLQILHNNKFLLEIVSKAFLIITEFWIYLLTYYTSIVSKTEEEKEKKDNKDLIILTTILIICATTTLFLPIKYAYNDAKTSLLYTYGLSTKMVFVTGMIYILFCLYYILKSRKKENISKKKYIPVYTYIILSTIVSFIQQINASVLLISYAEGLIVLLMYFTIENPDVKMVAELEIAKAAAEQANSAKTDFLANMSHEIRTPLNAIVNFSDFIEDAETLEEAKENAKDIVSASATLLEIVNGILDISKIEAGKIEIISAPYKAKDVFEELAKLISPRMKEKYLDFTYNIDPNMPKVLIGDSANLRKIVTNFLSNACKYTPAGFVKYTVGCEIINDTARLTISVQDSGQGVKKENLDKLFTKFQRLESDKNAAIEGTGLGLNITKQLAEMMGGEISVESEFGKGSTFTIVIDQKIGDDSLLDDTSKLDLNIDLSGIRMLMVDDNELNLKVGLKVFKNYNANLIDTAKDGFECLEKIKNNNNYDVILLDDQMPGMNGGQTLVELKKIEGFKTPVIALTANALTGMREKYISQGFNDYLAKPLEKLQIVKVFSQLIKDFNIKGNNKKEEENKMNEELNQNIAGAPVQAQPIAQPTAPAPQPVQQATPVTPEVPVAPTAPVAPAPVQPAVAPASTTPVAPAPVQPVVAPAPVEVVPQPVITAEVPEEPVMTAFPEAPVAPTPVAPVQEAPENLVATLPAAPEVMVAPVPATPAVPETPAVAPAPVEAAPVVSTEPTMNVEEPAALDPKQYLVSNGCDVDKALELLGDMEMYNETVSDFLEEVEEKWQRIQDYQLAGDMPNYAIEVHSLKSDARYLGFYVLGDIAYNHELASKENNVQFVNEHYPELVAEYDKTLNIIKKYREMI